MTSVFWLGLNYDDDLKLLQKLAEHPALSYARLYSTCATVSPRRLSPRRREAYTWRGKRLERARAWQSPS